MKWSLIAAVLFSLSLNASMHAADYHATLYRKIRSENYKDFRTLMEKRDALLVSVGASPADWYARQKGEYWDLLIVRKVADARTHNRHKRQVEVVANTRRLARKKHLNDYAHSYGAIIVHDVEAASSVACIILGGCDGDDDDGGKLEDKDCTVNECIKCDSPYVEQTYCKSTTKKCSQVDMSKSVDCNTCTHTTREGCGSDGYTDVPMYPFASTRSKDQTATTENNGVRSVRCCASRTIVRASMWRCRLRRN